MKVRIGKFARNGIESELGLDLLETARAAVCHYSAKLRAGRPPTSFPGFLAQPPGAAATGGTLELTVDPEVEAILAREAARQGVELDALAEHSVLVYLAELDFIGAPARLV